MDKTNQQAHPRASTTGPLVPPQLLLPVRRIVRLSHRGSLRFENKQDNQREGTGLAVCLPQHADTWSAIARLSGTLFTLTRADGTPGLFVDFYSCCEDAARMDIITAWAEAQGYLQRGTRYDLVVADSDDDTATDWDHEDDIAVAGADSTIQRFPFLTRAEAEAQLGAGWEDAQIEEVEAWLPTEAMQAACQWTRAPLAFVDDLVVVLYVEHCRPDLDGVWWDDDDVPTALSCPHGVIARHRLVHWTTRAEDTSPSVLEHDSETRDAHGVFPAAPTSADRYGNGGADGYTRCHDCRQQTPDDTLCDACECCPDCCACPPDALGDL